MSSTGTYGAEYYFDVDGLARVIMIGAGNDVNGVKYDYDEGTARYAWLETAIDDARSKNIPWVIVGMHKVCITAGQKGCEIGQDAMDLLLEKRVDLILQAHDHNYQRSKQLTCATANVYRSSCVSDDGSDGAYTKGAGGVFVVSGLMGGGGLYEVNTADSEFDYLAAHMGADKSGRGFVKVSASADRLQLDFVGSTTDYTDQFTIARP